MKHTFSSELTSPIFGRVGGGLFFMSSNTSAIHTKKSDLKGDTSVSFRGIETGGILAFFLEIFISYRFGIRKDAFRSSMYEFMVGHCFRVF